ncbi:MAG: hypothetical protein JO063_10380 [Pseudonocardiales bacterium]|nr:hypothetical protein [Pseudonocardiales bacterium]MBW0010504.1 hypothetical protein [Pseudonocardiales bacterium]
MSGVAVSAPRSVVAGSTSPALEVEGMPAGGRGQGTPEVRGDVEYPPRLNAG